MTIRIWPSIAAAQAHAARTARPPLVWDPETHLLSRFTFGAEPTIRAFLRAHGPDAWFADEIAGGKRLAPYAAVPAVAAAGPLLKQTPAQVRSWLKANGNEFGWEAMDQLSRVTLGLQAWSPARIYETVVDFFANHLNVSNHNGDLWNTRHTMDRDVIRRYALGSYTDMLFASARNPAMLTYLSLASSKKTAVNENFGRELLELHTVGTGARYTEDDVKNSARILTGRGLDVNANYVYRSEEHWLGAIQVLGFRHPNSSATAGEAAGDAYLRYLATHPSTATRLAQKMCVRYVSDTPSAALVSAVAASYLAGKTQIVPMLSTILRSDEFWSSRGAKVRRPTENLLATVRVLGIRPANMSQALQSLHWMTADLGNVPLDWGAPNGYPDQAAAWRSSGTLLTEWAYHRGLAQNWYQGFSKLNPEGLYGLPTPNTSGAAVDALTRRLTGMSFAPAHRAALQTFLGEPASTPLAKSNLRWYLSHLIPLILDAPHHALR
ncbi:DUF1800 domain-containing protein [Jatrophihabitans sp. DSM 45814]